MNFFFATVSDVFIDSIFYETQTEVTRLQLNRGQQFNSKAANSPKIVNERLEIIATWLVIQYAE